MKSSLKVGIVAGVIGASLLGAGVAFAATSLVNSQGVITGCVDTKHKGALRVISPGGQCAKTETQLPWNQAGLQGPTGATGPAGADGPKGEAGPAGAEALGHFTVATATHDVPPGSWFSGQATCGIGSVAISGGMNVPLVNAGIRPIGSYPAALAGEPRSWRSTGVNDGSQTETVTYYAVCAAGTYPTR